MTQFFLLHVLLACSLLFHACKSTRTASTTVQAAAAPAEKKLNQYAVQQDVPWVTVDGVTLTMDIYTPRTGKSNYPVYVIYHGGGWLINNETIMDEMSKYIVEHGDYVV